jgi:hypothetical protein
MKEIVLKGPEKWIERMLKAERLYLKRYGIKVIRRKSDKGPVKKKEPVKKAPVKKQLKSK